jgi:hypothetical protein
MVRVWGGVESRSEGALAVRTFKPRASLLILILILFGMLAVTAGDLGAKSRKLDIEPIRFHQMQGGSGGEPDTLYGGGGDPNYDTGDPDDCDLNIPLFLWLADHLF